MRKIPEAAALEAAMVAAYRPYVLRVLEERGLPAAEGIHAATAAGEAWLAEHLGALLSEPFRSQPRGPLEVFQEALGFPTAVLEEAGAAPVPRDPAAREALPGDLFDLAPASSRDLGDDVWAAHLAWGAAKARAFRPSAGLLSRDLMDATRLEQAVAAAGYRLVVWRSQREADLGAERPPVVFVDLTHPDADAVIGAAAAAGSRVIGFGPHVDDLAMVRARSLGAADALPRSAFFRSPASLLPRLT